MMYSPPISSLPPLPPSSPSSPSPPDVTANMPGRKFRPNVSASRAGVTPVRPTPTGLTPPTRSVPATDQATTMESVANIQESDHTTERVNIGGTEGVNTDGTERVNPGVTRFKDVVVSDSLARTSWTRKKVAPKIPPVTKPRKLKVPDDVVPSADIIDPIQDPDVPPIVPVLSSSSGEGCGPGTLMDEPLIGSSIEVPVTMDWSANDIHDLDCTTTDQESTTCNDIHGNGGSPSVNDIHEVATMVPGDRSVRSGSVSSCNSRDEDGEAVQSTRKVHSQSVNYYHLIVQVL